MKINIILKINKNKRKRMNGCCSLDVNNQCCYCAILILVIIGIIIIIVYCLMIYYTQTHEYDSKNIIYKYLSKVPGVRSEYWLMSHFILFTLLGFLFPNCILVLVLGGILWELIEYGLGKGVAPICRYVRGQRTCSNWFYTSFIDCIVNAVGALLGASIRNAIS